MSVVSLGSAHVHNLRGEKVTIEVDLSPGLYTFSIVGLPDKAIDESKDRVIAAIKNSGLKNPKTENHKVTVSLLPAGTKKEGSHFDVPIALGYLYASRQVPPIPKTSWFVGELSLSGEIQPVRGVLAMTEKAKASGAKEMYVPFLNKEEAALVSGITVYGVLSLRDLVNHLRNEDENLLLQKVKHTSLLNTHANIRFNLEDIRGQSLAKRALEIAAAGGHNIALYGPPGTGKTMLARAFTALLPPLTEEEALEVTRIHSVAHDTATLITHPPLRSPHHTSSYVSIIGGGASPKPGEVTLAHRGVLFLDEFPEFEKRVIESLREPLEEGFVSISRAKGTSTFPASCTVFAAMNPCPCGYLGSNVKRCTCTPGDIDRYARKLSGPIVDRIDLWVPVLHVDYETLSSKDTGEKTEVVQERIKNARDFATLRFSNKKETAHIRKNKDISAKHIEECIMLSKEGEALIKVLATKFVLSPRSYHRVMRVARSIADLEASSEVLEKHIMEAFQYRPKLYPDRV